MRGLRAEVEALPEGMRAVDADELRALPFPTALRVYRQIAHAGAGRGGEKDV